MCEAMPRWIASFTSSEEDQRDNGLPDSAGSVHASAVICARWAEGKKARTARARGLLQARAFSAGGSPLPNGGDITTALAGDGAVVPVRMLIGQYQDFCSYHLSMGCFAQTSDVLKASVFLCGQSDGMLRSWSSGHQTVPPLAGEQSQHTTDSSSENPLRIHRQVY